MDDEGQAEAWSHVAAGWSELWGTFARPAQDALITAAAIGPGTRVLDVGCGSGEFLEVLHAAGAEAQGADPASGMRELARARGFTVHRADAEHLPLPDASIDVVTAVNALHFADDTSAALHEFARVLAPGGRIAVANWAEPSRNDLDTIQQAIELAVGDEEDDLAEAADDSEPDTDTDSEPEDALSASFVEAGIRVIATGVVETPWSAPDENTLVRAILLGEDPVTLAELHATVVGAAAPFRTPDGGYLLRNAFRWAVGTV